MPVPYVKPSNLSFLGSPEHMALMAELVAEADVRLNAYTSTETEQEPESGSRTFVATFVPAKRQTPEPQD